MPSTPIMEGYEGTLSLPSEPGQHAVQSVCDPALTQLGHNIKNLRASKYLSQKELAKQCGAHQSTISAIERGKVSPDDALLASIAGILDTDVQSLKDLPCQDHGRDPVIFGRNLAFYRAQTGLTQRSFAEKIGIGEVFGYEAGTTYPSKPCMEAITAFLGVSEEVLNQPIPVVNYDDIRKDTTFGENLKRLRSEAGLTQTAIGQMTGISVQCISFYEHGQRFPAADALQKLADALHISPEVLKEHNVDVAMPGTDGEAS